MKEETLSNKLVKIDTIVYANEKAKLLNVNGITGDVIFSEDVKEFIKKLKIRLCLMSSGIVEYTGFCNCLICKVINEEAGHKLTKEQEKEE